MKKLLIMTYAVFLTLLVSCNPKENVKCIVIDLENTIHKQSPKNFKLNDIAQSMRLIPIETNDSVLFKHVIIVGTTEENIVAHSGNIGVLEKAVYFINKIDGKVSSVISRSGQGPEEYISIGDVHLNKQDNTLYLYDPNRKRINEYTFDGKFIRSIRNDSIGVFRMLKDGNFAVSYSPFVDTEFSLGIYDSSWNLKRRGIPRVAVDEKFDMIYFDAILEFNGEHFYKLAHCDTLYRITSEFEEPYLVHSKGKYEIPIDIKANSRKTEESGYRYIQQDGGDLISTYYFITFYYDNKRYREIWDIENSLLIYRSEYSRDGGINGVPVIINEKEIYVWPRYVSNESLYCLIENEDAISLIPSLPADTNPIILEVKIK
jgi:hypothetical protein